MVINGRMQYKSAIVVNDVFFRDLDRMLEEYFEKPRYSADLLNGDNIEFDSVSEVMDYDNFSSRAISTIRISYGIGNYIYIRPTISFINGYKSTIEMSFEIDSSDKCEEIKRKAKIIFDKHKQSTLYTMASKFAMMHICILLLALSFISNLHVLLAPKNQVFEIGNSTLVAIWTVGTILLLLVGYGISWLVNKCFPAIIFYLGENIKNVEKSSKLKSNIFWCVIVTAFVSALISLIF